MTTSPTWHFADSKPAERLIDALEHARTPILCRSDDPEWRINVSDRLRRFARSCALDVIDMWDAPSVVRQYLETGDEAIRRPAWDATARASSYAAKAAAATTWTFVWDAAAAASEYAAAARAATGSGWQSIWDAARAEHNERLERMVAEARAVRS